MAKRVRHRHSRLMIEDLVQVGWIELLRAAPHYDPSRGTPFLGYVRKRVRGKMIQYCAREAGVEDVPDFGASDVAAAMGWDGMSPSAEDLLLERELRSQRRSAAAQGLWRLDKVSRRLVWCDAQGAAITESARALGIGYGAAKYRLAVAARELVGVDRGWRHARRR